MEHLDDTTIEELQHALDNVDGKNPTKRLLAAIAYKNGISQTELAEWYGVERKTIYNWLTRLESSSLTESVEDDKRSGRNRKLTNSQQEYFKAALHEPPEKHGYDSPAWSPALTQQFLTEEFDVEYSIPSCRRLMKEAGLRYQKPRRSAPEADEAKTMEFDEGIYKSEKRWMPR